MTMRVPEHCRVRTGRFASDARFGCNGAFFVPNRLSRAGPPFKVIASDGGGWEHVSVSLPHRCPTWEEMAFVKSMFWTDEDCVVQFHPPRSEYVNNHPYCLHLWRQVGAEFPMPPALMVGFKEMTPAQMAALPAAKLLAMQLEAGDELEGNR